jgi:malate synthase
LPDGLEVRAPPGERYDEVLSRDALALLAELHRELDAERRACLGRRRERAARLAEGEGLDFLAETRAVREGEWRVAPVPDDLQDRRVEITGPPQRKMTINALNSGARGWMADFEDSTSPTWRNVVEGHLNLVDAIERTIEHSEPDGREYRLAEETATILVRPRGWHLVDRHVLVDGEQISGSLLDFGLFMANEAPRLLERGSGPYLYLPKLESHREARLWNAAFELAQDRLAIPRGTIKATVLIETVPAAFEMDEILHELREHSAGLNAGRWDYIFSMIKCFRERPEFVLPDRTEVKMTVPFMRAYTELLVKTCHHRGAHAMGGMAAQIPSRSDAEAAAAAIAAVRADKRREAGDGFDGTWVAHPDTVAAATEEFDAVLGERPSQIERRRDDVHVTAAELLDVAATPGAVTEAGLRLNVNVGIQYISSWLRGNGAAAIYGLMEDAATAEISRSQVWQWLRHRVSLSNGTRVDRDLVRRLEGEELYRIRSEIGDDEWFEREGRPALSRELFEQVALAPDYAEFLTIPAYERLEN